MDTVRSEGATAAGAVGGGAAGAEGAVVQASSQRIMPTNARSTAPTGSAGRSCSRARTAPYFPISELGTFQLGADGLEPSGSLSATLALTGDCIGEAVPHEMVLDWDFPVHDERSVRVREEMCCGPLVGLRP